MDPITIGLLAGGGAGLLKNVFAQQAAGKQREAQAAVARYSPWTGMQAQMVEDPNMFGDVLQGGAMGAMAGQSLGGASPAAAVGETPAQASGYSLGVDYGPSSEAMASQSMMASPYNFMGKKYQLANFATPTK